MGAFESINMPKDNIKETLMLCNTTRKELSLSLFLYGFTALCTLAAFSVS
jgi:hypothetical protein